MPHTASIKKMISLALALMLAALIFPHAPAGSKAEPARSRTEAAANLLEACDRLSEMKSACSGEVTKGAPGEPFNSARLIVKTAGEPDTSGAIGFAEGTNGRWVLQYASPDEAEAAAERFSSDPLVKYAVPDTEYRVSFSPSGDVSDRQGSYNSWGFGEEHVDMAALTERLLAKYGSESAMPEVIVAVCDSGVNVNHEFLEGRTVPGYDFVNNDSDPADGFGHGTFCAGVVADGTLSNVRIMPLKCISDEGYFSTGDVVNAIEYAYLNGCAAANLSLIEYNPYVEALYEEAVNAASDAGMVCCVASGNWSGNASSFVPGKIERSFTVAAHYPDHTMWPLSNVGEAVDITAPGVDITSTLNTGGFDVQSGTSFAAPHAAACCAAIKTYDPDIDPDEIMALLKANAIDEGYSGGGAGRLYVGSLFSDDPLPVLWGDVNGDGVVDSVDALMCLRAALGLISLEGSSVLAADVNGDGEVTSEDALMILRRALGIRLFAGASEGVCDELLHFNEQLGEMIKEYACCASRDRSAWSTSRIIVGCRGELDTSGSLAHVRGCGRYVIQYATPVEAMAAAERYAARIGVEYAVPDSEVKFDLSMGGSDPEKQEPGVDSFKSWGFGEGYMNAYAYNEWLMDSAGDLDALPEIIVAVIDSGLEYDHPFFAGRTVPGWDFGDNDGDTGGGFFHGTHVAGTVVDGTLPNVKVMALKCTDDNGVAVTSVIINCIQYAYQHGAKVANVSMGGYYPETAAAYTSVINAGADSGMVTCIASGNDSMNVAYCYPACIERALTVAAHDRSFDLWSGSNTGDAVDITAPGVDIVSAMPNGGFQAQTGTSMASPHAAAACAMLMSHDPSMSADAVMNAIKSASVDHGISGGGAGVLCMTALVGQVPFIPGDADGDGMISSADALLTLRYVLNIVSEASLDIDAADMDGDGTVTSADALMILRKAMGIIS